MEKKKKKKKLTYDLLFCSVSSFIYTSLCSGFFPPAFVGLNQLKIDPTVISGLFGLIATVSVRFYPRLHNTWFLPVNQQKKGLLVDEDIEPQYSILVLGFRLIQIKKSDKFKIFKLNISLVYPLLYPL